jgi:predicted nuclease of predicted toxin-antitoxin system
MRFLVDECTSPSVARWLQSLGHEVFSVYDLARGSSDADITQQAFDEDRILITNDKDFGEMVFRSGKPHHGVILLRLEDERAANKIAVLEKLLTNYENRIPDNFIVVTERSIRIIQKS